MDYIKEKEETLKHVIRTVIKEDINYHEFLEEVVDVRGGFIVLTGYVNVSYVHGAPKGFEYYIEPDLTVVVLDVDGNELRQTIINDL